MSSLSTDFDAYAAMLNRRNRLAMVVLMTATVMTGLLAVAHFMESFGWLPPVRLPLDGLVSGEDLLTRAIGPFVDLDDINALHMSALTAQIAAAAALRLWFTRQERMTTLLTHALVLEGENEAAIKVLLHKDMAE